MAVSSSPTRHFCVVSAVDALGYERCLHCAASAGVLLHALEGDGFRYPVSVFASDVQHGEDPHPCDSCGDPVVPAGPDHAARLAERAMDAVALAPTQPERDAFTRLADWYWGLA